MTSIIHDFPSIARKLNRTEQKAEWDEKNPPVPSWYSNMPVCYNLELGSLPDRLKQATGSYSELTNLGNLT